MSRSANRSQEFHPTAAFHSAFDREVARLLRVRFTWLMALWLGLVGCKLVFGLFVGLAFQELALGQALVALWHDPVSMGATVLRVTTLTAALVLVRWRAQGPKTVLRLAYWVYVFFGIFLLIGAVGMRLNRPFEGWFLDPMNPTDALSIGWAIVPMALAHFGACLLLPWRPGQGVKPLLILYPLWLGFVLVYEQLSLFHVAFGGLIAPSISGLGLLICWWRHSRLRSEVELRELRRQFTVASQALIDAQKIHEQRFPDPMGTDRAKFTYVYEPMRQVGGDFLHVHIDRHKTMHVVLFDVTGHGIAAALTVNRVDGEIKRLAAEDPTRDLLETATAINRYFHLIMARHGIFATAVFLKIHENGQVEWVNAGHPPPVIRKRDGSVEMLETSAFMLGAVSDAHFDAQCRTTQLETDETVVIYTDGATEAADRHGRQFGIKGVVRAIESWQPISNTSLVSFVPEVVRQFRSGATTDDILIAAVAYV